MRLPNFSALFPALDPNPMRYEDAVLVRYPHAGSVYNEPIYECGDSSPCCEGEWVIFALPEHQNDELGRGDSEAAAWADAARNVAARLVSEEEAA